MADEWYELADPETPLTQGDLIFDCPVLVWDTEELSVSGADWEEQLQGHCEAHRADVVVMTQACDLAQGKVAEVVLCPHYSLQQEYRQQWVGAMEGLQQHPSDNAWKKHLKQVNSGFLWNLALLDKGMMGDIVIDHRVVDFTKVFSLPRGFLEAVVARRGRSRPRLRPPYREHLSQAFARFFMRVGLPTDIELPV